MRVAGSRVRVRELLCVVALSGTAWRVHYTYLLLSSKQAKEHSLSGQSGVCIRTGLATKDKIVS